MKKTVVATGALVLGAAVVYFVLQYRAMHRWRAENAGLRQEMTALAEAPPAREAAIVTQTQADLAELERLRGEPIELLRLRGEASQLRRQLHEVKAHNPASGALAATTQRFNENPPPPFADVTTNAIPSRYRWTELDEQGTATKAGIITLHPDGSFTNMEGERVSDYKWRLHPHGLMLTWRNGISLFTRVEAPGVYVSLKENNQSGANGENG